MKHARLFLFFILLGFSACSGYEGGGDVLVAGGTLDGGGTDAGGTAVDSGKPRLDGGSTDARSEQGPVKPSTVIAYYPFDSEGADHSPRNGGLSLTLSNTEFQQAVVMNALAPLGNGVAASRPKVDPELAFGASDFTIQAWMRTDGPLIGFGTRPASGAATDGWAMFMTPVAAWFATNDSRGTLSTAVAAGQVHHVVVRRASGNVDLFIDGSKRTSRSAWPAIGSDSVFSIAQAQLSNTAPALVDELVIWSRALTDTQITTNFTRNNSGQPVILTE